MQYVWIQKKRKEEDCFDIVQMDVNDEDVNNIMRDEINIVDPRCLCSFTLFRPLDFLMHVFVSLCCKFLNFCVYLSIKWPDAN